jgi:hypothetical protein
MLLICPQCHAKAQTKCDCGIGYIPAGDLARQEVIRNPQKSDRAIAKQLGITHPTVAAARKAVGKNLPGERRQGRDGKQYPAHKAVRHQVPKGRKGPGIPVPKTEKFPGLYRLQTAWFMATRQETEMFLEWVKHQRERTSNVVELQRTGS